MKNLFSALLTTLLFLTSNYSFAQVTVTPNAGGNPYANLEAAFTQIELGVHGANPIATITQDFTEPFVVLSPVPPAGFAPHSAATLKQTPQWSTLTINTAGNFTVTCQGQCPIITFGDLLSVPVDAGADFVTINGDIGGVRSLTLKTDPSAGGSGFQGCIQMSNGSSNNVVKNIICTTGLTGVVPINGRLINIGQSTAAFGGNNNNTVDNCMVDGGSRAIQTFGTAGVNTNDNTVITNNKITNANTLGIFIGSQLNGVTCNGNDVSINRGLAATVVNYRGISIQGGGTINCIGNNVHNLTNTTAGSAFTYIGIISIPQPSIGVTSYVINFINNCVTLMDNNLTSGFIYGIFPASNATSPASTQNIYHNTVRLGGTGAVVPANGYFACLPINVTITGSTVNSYNNVCSYERTANNATSFGIAYDLTSYPAPGVTLNSDYNNGNAYANTFGWDGGYGNTVYQNNGIDNYKDSLCALAIEQHTSFDSLLFTGLNSCVLAPGTIGGNMNGKTNLTPPVTTDIFGTVRSALYPYRGAYEGPALRVLTVNARLEGVSTTKEVTVVLYDGACNAVASSSSDLLSTQEGKFAFGDKVATGGAGYYIFVETDNHLRTSSNVQKVFTVGGLASHDFRTAQSQAFGSNQIFEGGVWAIYGGDVNQDGIIDVTDNGLIDNDAFNFVAGCRITNDVNNDGVVDVTDAVIADNNGFNFIAENLPCPAPASIIGTLPLKQIGTATLKNININTLGF